MISVGGNYRYLPGIYFTGIYVPGVTGFFLGSRSGKVVTKYLISSTNGHVNVQASLYMSICELLKGLYNVCVHMLHKRYGNATSCDYKRCDR